MPAFVERDHPPFLRPAMHLTGFQIFRYRNFIDSGWVEVDGIAALVGQNECGKSNLLQALYKLRPYDEAEYDLDTDWPIDDWGNRDPDTEVCRAQYDLAPDEFDVLLAEVGGRGSAAAVPAAVHEDSLEALASSSVQPRTRVWVSRNYRNEYRVQFAPEVAERLDADSAAKWVIGRMPRCVYMDDYATFAGHAELHGLAERLEKLGPDGLREEERTILATLDLASLDLGDLVTKGGSDKGRAIRAFDTGAASRVLNQRFRHKWRQQDVRFQLRVDGSTLDILVEDEGLDAPVPLQQRSRGFQWFASFIWRFARGSEGTYAGCMLLLDEPGVHLHHAGHRDLLSFLRTVGVSNTILYTTHLPTMLEAESPERIRILEIHDHHSRVVNGVCSPQAEPMMVIEALLGLGPGVLDHLGFRQSLILGGAADVLVLERLSDILRRSGELPISDDITLVPAAQVSDAPLLAGYLIGKGYDSGVLLDSDAGGREAAAKIRSQFLNGYGGQAAARFRVLSFGEAVGRRGEEFGIEDLFPIGFYLHCVNDAYQTNLSEDDLTQGETGSNSRRAQAALASRGREETLDRRQVLYAVRRRLDRARIKADLPPGSYTKIRTLFDKINAAFDAASSR